jgi:hypothetical protein
MSETELETTQTESQDMSDQEALYKIAQAMKDTPTQDDKQNVHTFPIH